MAYKVPVPKIVSTGGTGVQSNTAYAVLCGGTTSTAPVQSIASVGTSGQILTSNGAGALPTFQTLTGGDFVFLNTATANNSASVEFSLSSSYYAFKVFITGMTPTTEGFQFILRTSSNGGSSFDNGASDYAWVAEISDMATAPAQTDGGSAGANAISLAFGTLGNAANEFDSYEITIFNPSVAAYCQMNYRGQITNSAGTRFMIEGSGVRLTAADVDAIQFSFETVGFPDTIGTGIFKLYGMVPS